MGWATNADQVVELVRTWIEAYLSDGSGATD